MIAGRFVFCRAAWSDKKEPEKIDKFLTAPEFGFMLEL